MTKIYKYFFQFISLIVVIKQLSIINAMPFNESLDDTDKIENQLIIMKIYDDLPADIHRLFNASFTFAHFHQINTAVIVYLIDPTLVNNTVVQHEVFGTVNQHSLAKPVIGEYFTIKQFDNIPALSQVNLAVKFQPIAKNKTFAVFYAKNFNKFVIPAEGKIMYQHVLQCTTNSPPKLIFTIGNQNSTEPGFMPNVDVWLNCTATIEHKPYGVSSTIEGLDEKFEVIETGALNNIKINLKPHCHNKVLICRAGNYSVSHTIKMYHYPTKIEIDPDVGSPMISSVDTIPYNKSIFCRSMDGYPEPVVKWTVHLGSHNTTQYYKLVDNERALIFHNIIPPGTKWIFICSASNTIPNLGTNLISQSLEINIATQLLKLQALIIGFVVGSVLLAIFIICLLKCSVDQKAYNKKTVPFKPIVINSHVRSFDIDPESKVKLNGHLDGDISQNLNKASKLKVPNMADDDSSTAYSIENGIVEHSIFVLDSNRFNWDQSSYHSQISDCLKGPEMDNNNPQFNDTNHTKNNLLLSNSQHVKNDIEPQSKITFTLAIPDDESSLPSNMRS